jgi:hypothetical protein
MLKVKQSISVPSKTVRTFDAWTFPGLSVEESPRPNRKFDTFRRLHAGTHPTEEEVETLTVASGAADTDGETAAAAATDTSNTINEKETNNDI